MSTDFQTSKPISPRPGFLKSIFIHLAGGDPNVFPYLPSHEATDFAKLGASVLVPAVLALTAGTYTVWHMAPEQGWLVAGACGLVWAGIILIIDVAVMSQIIKPCRVPPPPPQPVGPARAFAEKQETQKKKEEEPELPWMRNKIIGGLRIFISIVLGIFISHSLVLALFHKRIDQKLQLQRVADLAKLNDYSKVENSKEALLSTANQVAGESDDTFFRQRYKDYQAMLGRTASVDSTTTEAAPDGDPDPPKSSDSTLAKLQADLAENVEKQKTATADHTTQVDLAQGELNNVESDLREATKMKLTELRGDVAAFNFYTAEAKYNLGTSTSGKKGKGSKVAAIEKEIANLTTLREQKAAALKTVKDRNPVDASLVAEEKRLQTDVEDRKNKLREMLLKSTAEEDTRHDDKVKALKTETDRERTALAADIQRLTTEAASARTVASEARAPFEGSTDFLEQTSALLGLIFNKPDAEEVKDPDSRFKQPVFAATVLVVLLSLILIDLAPLMMKLLRAPGAYDVYLAMVRAHRFTVPLGAGFVAPPVAENGASTGNERRPPPRKFGVVSPADRSAPPPPPPGGGRAADGPRRRESSDF